MLSWSDSFVIALGVWFGLNLYNGVMAIQKIMAGTRRNAQRLRAEQTRTPER